MSYIRYKTRLTRVADRTRIRRSRRCRSRCDRAASTAPRRVQQHAHVPRTSRPHVTRRRAHFLALHPRSSAMKTSRPRCRHRRRRPDRLRLLFRIAAGEMLGRDQPVILQLLELPIDKAQAALKGVMMELEDCAFPLLAGMSGTGDPEGRVQGRRLSRCSSARGRAARAWSARTCCSRTRRSSSSRARRSTRSRRATSRCWSSAIPANTNAYIAMKSAPSLPKKNFTAMLRLDHNRALSQLAREDRQAGRRDREARRLGQPLADDVRRLPLRDRRRPIGQGR